MNTKANSFKQQTLYPAERKFPSNIFNNETLSRWVVDYRFTGTNFANYSRFYLTKWGAKFDAWRRWHRHHKEGTVVLERNVLFNPFQP